MHAVPLCVCKQRSEYVVECGEVGAMNRCRKDPVRGVEFVGMHIYHNQLLSTRACACIRAPYKRLEERKGVY